MAAVLAPQSRRAQAVIARNGWEAFPGVEYQGGDGTQPKKRWGVLALTDSALGFYPCFDIEYCQERKGKLLVWDKPIFVVPLRQVTEVSSSSQVRGASVTGKLAFGLLANDRAVEFFGFVLSLHRAPNRPSSRCRRRRAAHWRRRSSFASGSSA